MSLVSWAIGQCVLVLLSSDEDCLGFRVAAAKSASDYCKNPNVSLGRELFSFRLFVGV